MSASDIVIRAAREHNLRDVDLRLPRNRLICFTGVSGSGKSSLAFDTLYAEGQRRYVQSLSSFARQFLGQMPKPDVDLITGLNPAISISQKTGGQSPRSTVGTITEINDYLRVLFARVGKGHCPQCGRPITAQTREQIIQRILALPAETHFLVLAPLVRGQKGEYRDLFADLLKQGFARARVDGRVVRLSDDLRLDRQMRHNIEVVIDRLVVGPKVRPRLAEAVELALRLGEGNLVVTMEEEAKAEGGRRKAEDDDEPATENQEPAARRSPSRAARSSPPSPFPLTPSSISLSAHYACTHCNLSFEPPSPQLFSFNNPQGMCLECSGLGQIYTFDPQRLIPTPAGPFSKGASDWSDRGARWVAGGGTSTAAWPKPWNESTACRRAPSSKRHGKNSIPNCKTLCSGAPATSTSPSPGAVDPRATNGAESSRESSPSCSRNIAPPKAECNAASWKSTCASWTVAVATGHD